eukprot:5566615-Pyramimonas_sp.AAC.1
MAPPGRASLVREVRRSKVSTAKPHWAVQLVFRDRRAIPEVPVLVSPRSSPRNGSEVPRGPRGPLVVRGSLADRLEAQSDLSFSRSFCREVSCLYEGEMRGAPCFDGGPGQVSRRGPGGQDPGAS